MLLSYGADMAVKNKAGDTPIDLFLKNFIDINIFETLVSYNLPLAIDDEKNWIYLLLDLGRDIFVLYILFYS